MITVGQITKPQGVRGEVKVKPLTDDPSRFCVLKTAYVGDVPYKISAVRISGADVFIKFDGVDDRDRAEALRNKFIRVDRAAAVALEDGEFFIADLIGAKLVAAYGNENRDLGVIRSIRSYGAADVFTVERSGGGEMSFAFIKALNARFDLSNGVLTVDGGALDCVAVYDED